MIGRIYNRIRYELQKRSAKRTYLKSVAQEFDYSWFSGKRVAVIGGANSVLEEKLGAYIDAFDVVVRINKGVEVIEKQKEFVGSKTDILFHGFYENPNDKGSSPVTPSLWRECGVGQLLFSLNYDCSSYAMQEVKRFVNKTNGKVPFAQVPAELYKKNANAIASYVPTTGFIAINTIMNCKPAELYVTGITFFKTAHNTAYRSGTVEEYKASFDVHSSHNPDKEFEFVKKLYKNYPDVLIPDKTLKRIFETN